ncbi:MAG: hypothetical protein AB8B56_02320 [Crocinitomicaceae bacterium]
MNLISSSKEMDELLVLVHEFKQVFQDVMEEHMSKKMIQLFPNPASNFVTMHVVPDQLLDVRICTLNGNVVESFRREEN